MWERVTHIAPNPCTCSKELKDSAREGQTTSNAWVGHCDKFCSYVCCDATQGKSRWPLKIWHSKDWTYIAVGLMGNYASINPLTVMVENPSTKELEHIPPNLAYRDTLKPKVQLRIAWDWMHRMNSEQPCRHSSTIRPTCQVQVGRGLAECAWAPVRQDSPLPQCRQASKGTTACPPMYNMSQLFKKRLVIVTTHHMHANICIESKKSDITVGNHTSREQYRHSSKKPWSSYIWPGWRFQTVYYCYI